MRKSYDLTLGDKKQNRETIIQTMVIHDLPGDDGTFLGSVKHYTDWSLKLVASRLLLAILGLTPDDALPLGVRVSTLDDGVGDGVIQTASIQYLPNGEVTPIWIIKHRRIVD